MMLNSRKSLRDLLKLSFCYLCGKTFVPTSRQNKDHVPPKKMFAIADRFSPLILPAHEECNNSRSDEDELVGQMVALLHGKRPGSDRLRKTLSVFTTHGSNEPLLGISGVNLNRIIWRWVQGFHAALYQESVSVFPGGFIFPPMPAGHLKQGKVAMEDDQQDREI